MIIAAALALALQTAPPEPSAQCLMQIGALSGETFMITDERMRTAATAKYESIYRIHERLVAANREADRAEQVYLEKVKTDEAAGTLPRGSYEVTRSQLQREAMLRDANETAANYRTSSCVWPS